MWRLLLGTMGVKSLVQGLNAAATAGFEPRTVWSEVRLEELFAAPFAIRCAWRRRWQCTLGADEAKMYNCLIFRGRVGPNARLTASMHVNARENRHAAGMSTAPAHLFRHLTNERKLRPNKKKKGKEGFALHLLSVCRKSMLWETKIMKEKARNNAGSAQGAGWHWRSSHGVVERTASHTLLSLSCSPQHS